MQNLGVKLLAVSFCCIGVLLGQVLREISFRHPTVWMRERLDLLAFALLGNFLAFSALIVCFRRRAAEPPLESSLRPIEVLVRGVPANNRVAFLIFSAAWVLGTVLGMAFKGQ